MSKYIGRVITRKTAKNNITIVCHDRIKYGKYPKLRTTIKEITIEIKVHSRANSCFKFALNTKFRLPPSVRVFSLLLNKCVCKNPL
jgi:hypothetical protein